MTNLTGLKKLSISVLLEWYEESVNEDCPMYDLATRLGIDWATVDLRGKIQRTLESELYRRGATIVI